MAGRRRLTQRDDDALLELAVSGNARAFAVFYERHHDAVLAYFHRRAAGRADLAFDLSAETFAQLVASLHRFDRSRGSALAFLFGIAANVLKTSLRAGRVEDAARRELQLEVLRIDASDVDDILTATSSVSEERLEELLALLPAAQRTAVLGRVVDQVEYQDLAAAMDCSEAVVRQRVSRGLGFLRTRLEALR